MRLQTLRATGTLTIMSLSGWEKKYDSALDEIPEDQRDTMRTRFGGSREKTLTV
ncbi:MAG TPA: hypothetical protein VNY07_04120 [Chthoniobacterales bacterium]|nr:hypothetical protein [Chthoniobacterales bacterium]